MARDNNTSEKQLQIVEHYERVVAYLYPIIQIGEFLRDEMQMEYSKWSVAPVNRGINFLGYRIWPTHKLLRKQSVRDAKRKIVHYRKHGKDEKLRAFLGAWFGHVMWANSHNLKQALEVQS